MVRQIILAAVLLGGISLTSGCLIMSGKSIDESGVQVSSDTLRQVEPGVTSEAWLVATLGEPSERTTVEDQERVEILRYDYTIAKSEGGTVFLLFAGGSETRKTTRTYFEVTDGVVTRYWTER
jgi:outer membrane protein assembly factor BamE (lipoprotein component of BamABCDE complex)